jgi:hypothetical protein
MVHALYQPEHISSFVANRRDKQTSAVPGEETRLGAVFLYTSIYPPRFGIIIQRFRPTDLYHRDMTHDDRVDRFAGRLSTSVTASATSEQNICTTICR